MSQARGTGEAKGTVRIIAPPLRGRPINITGPYLGRQRPDGAGPLLSAAVMDGLTSTAENGAIESAMATRWIGGDQARRWIFILNEGIDNERIAFLLNRTTTGRGAYRGSPRAIETEGLIERWETVGKKGIKAICYRPAPEMPAMMAKTHFKIPITEGQGVTGPYEMLATNSEDSPDEATVRLIARKRNEQPPWARKAKARQIRVTFESNPSDRIEAVLANEADLAMGVQGADPQTIEKTKEQGLKVMRYRSEWVPVATAHTEVWPGNDNEVMKKLKESLDREQLAKEVYGDYARLGYDHALSGGEIKVDECPGKDTNTKKTANTGRTIEVRWHHPEHERLAHAMTKQWNENTPFEIVAKGPPHTNKEEREGGIEITGKDLTMSSASEVTLETDPRWSGTGWNPTPGNQRLSVLAHLAQTEEQRETILKTIARIVGCEGPHIIAVVPERIDIARPQILKHIVTMDEIQRISNDQLVARIGGDI